MILFRCPGCGSNLKVPEETAGKQGKCYLCGQVFRIPLSGELPPAGGSATEPETLPPRDRVPATVAPLGPRGGETQAPARPEARQTVDAEEAYGFLAPAQGPGELGRLGPYRVLKSLGQGGMGIVFEAEDPALRRRVALKVLRPDRGGATARQRFLREAQALARVHNDHVIAIHAVGEEADVPYMAMELLDGESLDERLRRKGRLPLAEVLRIGRETTQGLAAAHDEGLIHRDVKPGNLWLAGVRRPGSGSSSAAQAPFRIKILDFGLARAEGEEHLTRTGAVVGTPQYMAPEQARNRGVDHRSDLYGLGCVLYRACTGRVPFEGDDILSVLEAMVRTKPEPPRILNPEVPAALSALILKLMAREPEDRPASAWEVIEALDRIEVADTARDSKPSQPAAPRVGSSAGPTARRERTGESTATVELGARRKKQPKERNNLLVGGIVLAGVLLLLCAGGVGAFSLWHLFWTDDGPDPEVAAAPPAADGQAVVNPNAPPQHAPPPAQPGPNPPPVGPLPANADAIPLQTLQAIKDATAFIKVEAGNMGGSGSGFIILAEGDTGYVVTNHHVINPKPDEPAGGFPRFPRFPPRLLPNAAAQISVVFQSGTPQERSAAATVVAQDEADDLAILRVGARGLPAPIEYRQRPQLVETLPVFIFGFPFGEALAINKGNPAITVGKGNVSSIRRDQKGELALIQIDGELNPGNSGGPVVDALGRLVGVSVAKIRNTRIGLAIPPEKLWKLAAGRVRSLTVLRKKTDQGRTDLQGEVWVYDGQNKVQRVGPRNQHVGAPGQAAVGAPAGQADLQLEVEAGSALKKVRSAALLYVRATPNRPAPAGPDGRWLPLEGALKLDLPLANDRAVVNVSVPEAGPADEYLFQVVYQDADGQTVHTQPKAFRLTRTAAVVAQAPAVNANPAPPPGAPLPPRPPPANVKKLTEEELKQALEDLGSPDYFRCKRAAEVLSKVAEPNEKFRPEVARALEKLLDDKQRFHAVFIRRHSAEALGVWGTPQSVAVMIRTLQTEQDVFLGKTLIEALSRLKPTPPEAAEPIAASLANFFLRRDARKALEQMGRTAEKAVVKQLEHPDVGTRVEACHVLKVIGTKESVPALERAQKDSNRQLADAAAEALKVVAGR